MLKMSCNDDLVLSLRYLTLFNRCYFAQHDKTMLIGADPSHIGDRCIRVTIHHCFFDGTRQRQPRLRFGKVHLYNNFTRSWGIYAVCASVESQVSTSLVSSFFFCFSCMQVIGIIHVNNDLSTFCRYTLSATFMKQELRKRLLNSIQRKQNINFFTQFYF